MLQVWKAKNASIIQCSIHFVHSITGVDFTVDDPAVGPIYPGGQQQLGWAKWNINKRSKLWIAPNTNWVHFKVTLICCSWGTCPSSGSSTVLSRGLRLSDDPLV